MTYLRIWISIQSLLKSANPTLPSVKKNNQRKTTLLKRLTLPNYTKIKGRTSGTTRLNKNGNPISRKSGDRAELWECGQVFLVYVRNFQLIIYLTKCAAESMEKVITLLIFSSATKDIFNVFYLKILGELALSREPDQGRP